MTEHTRMTQVLIMGAGPAGLALAAACCREGLDVLVLDREHVAWRNQYAAWEDELNDVGWHDGFKHVWPNASVWIDEGEQRLLNRAYGVVDNERCRRMLLNAADGAEWVVASVSKVEPDGFGGRVICEDGRVFEAECIVDAMGSAGKALHRSEPTSFQTAYGILAEVQGAVGQQVVTLMDFRDPGPGAPMLPGGLPSFLYCMQWPDGRWFFEETVLVARPKVPIDLLKKRLYARLKARGIEVLRVDEVERCQIGMDVELPRRDSAVLSFGAAAGLVHPATGYSFVECLRRAPRIAAECANQLRFERPARSNEALMDALWTPDERKCHALYQFGSNAVSGFEAADTRRFMRAFFALPDEVWSAYLSRRLTGGDVQSTMLTMFRKFPLRLKRKMTGISFWNPKLLVRGMFGH
jgi:lycopene beta-cyclase